jgi:hypothetical protein
VSGVAVVLIDDMSGRADVRRESRSGGLYY